MTEQDYKNIASLVFDNDWDDNPTIKHNNYHITQFQGTAFDSNYKCYKAQIFPSNYLAPVVLSLQDIHTFVVKITNSRENDVLQLLLKEKLSVPKIQAVLRLKNERVMLFEQFVPGKELYSITEHDIWKKTARCLADIHSKFWHMDTKETNNALNYQTSVSILDKINIAQSNINDHPIWQKYMALVKQRLASAPKTLIHGDLFPTNILVNNNEIYFVDWADASIYAYMMDIGRLTAVIDKKTLLPMCPYPEAVIEEYYEQIKTVLQADYSDYLNDIYMAQFIELANLYVPQGSLGSLFLNREYNRIVENQINGIVLEYFKHI